MTKSIICVFDACHFFRMYLYQDGYPTEVLTLIKKAMSPFNKKPSSTEMKNALLLHNNLIDEEFGENRIHKDDLFTAKRIHSHPSLQWVYMLDVEYNRLDIYGGEYGSAKDLINNGLSNPLIYLENLIDKHKESEEEEIKKLVIEIENLKYLVNAPPNSVRFIKESV